MKFLRFSLHTYIVISFLFWHNTSFSQNSFISRKEVSDKVLKYYKEGLENLNNKELEKAIVFFDKALKEEPTFIDAIIRKGGAYQAKKDLKSAIEYYSKAYQLSNTYEQILPLSIGENYYALQEFDSAAAYVEKYINNIQTETELKKHAIHLLQQCNFAKEAIKHPVPFNPIRLDDELINTSNPEYKTCINAEGDKIIFTRVINGQEDFYFAVKKDNHWTKAEPLLEINTPYNEGAQSLSADGKTLAFTGCNYQPSLGSCDIYISEFKNGKWSKPQNLGQPINSASWESQPSLNADGTVVYFCAERGGGIGGKDIWVSTKDKSGKWSKPTNLGAEINTPYDEQSPFIHPDGRTLYFVSNGHPGMGDFDLYMSKKVNNKWTKPQNLGYPINTIYRENSITIALDGKTAYIDSDRADLLKLESLNKNKNNEKINLDIYTFELAPNIAATPSTYIKAIITDAKTGYPVGDAKVEIENLIDNQLATSITSDDLGTFLACISMGINYGISIEKKGYLIYSQNIDLSEVHQITSPYIINIQLVPIEPASNTTAASTKPIRLENIFFATGSAELLKSSFIELNKLKDMLIENPSVRIQINGHTDNVGSDQSNLELSNNRAKAVYDFLISGGIPSHRLKYSGFGSTKPIAENATAEGRQLNRRTEFQIW
ncbi:MAG: PD40 domain-containing protein [Saprospiraceae bacterium]|nr:PD40 domain-containing protein [Saprospiraceae bacterium]